MRQAALPPGVCVHAHTDTQRSITVRSLQSRRYLSQPPADRRSSHPTARIHATSPRPRLLPVRARRLFPPFSAIREVSAQIMAAVARHMVASGAGSAPPGWSLRSDWVPLARGAMWGAPGAKL